MCYLMYTMIVSKPDDCIHKSEVIFIFPKSAKFLKDAISYKNKIVPEIIYLTDMYICTCIISYAKTF